MTRLCRCRAVALCVLLTMKHCYCHDSVSRWTCQGRTTSSLPLQQRRGRGRSCVCGVEKSRCDVVEVRRDVDRGDIEERSLVEARRCWQGKGEKGKPSKESSFCLRGRESRGGRHGTAYDPELRVESRGRLDAKFNDARSTTARRFQHGSPRRAATATSPPEIEPRNRIEARSGRGP